MAMYWWHDAEDGRPGRPLLITLHHAQTASEHVRWDVTIARARVHPRGSRLVLRHYADGTLKASLEVIRVESPR